MNHVGDIDYADRMLYISLDTSTYDAAGPSFNRQAFALNPPYGVHDITNCDGRVLKGSFTERRATGSTSAVPA